MKHIAIDIGSRNIRMVEGEATASGVKITRFASEETGPDVINEGEIKDAGVVSNRLGGLINTGFSSKNVTVTINTESIFVREFEIPFIKNKKQFSSMVHNEMITTFAANEEDIIEYRLLSLPANKKGGECTVRAMAINRELVDGYHKSITTVKLKPMVMMTHINSIERMVAKKGCSFNSEDLTDKNVLLVDFGHSGIMAYMFCNGKVYSSRFIPIGLSDLAKELENRLIITADQALENMSEHIDISDTTETDEKNKEARNFFTQCSNELQKFIMHAIGRMPKQDATVVYITGGASKVKGIEGFFAESLKSEVKLLTSVSAITVASKNTDFDLSLYLNAACALMSPIRL